MPPTTTAPRPDPPTRAERNGSVIEPVEPRRSTREKADKPKRPSQPVHIELVEEELPPPPAPKMKPIDQILAVVEAADLEPGKWMRVALFVSSRAARATATRLRNRTGDAYEWLAPGDDRLFVRIPPVDGE